MAPVESVWGVEMGWGFQRAATTYVQEAGCCATGSAAEVALFAWDDGSNWLDAEGEVGWSDFPPIALEAVAAASD